VPVDIAADEEPRLPARSRDDVQAKAVEAGAVLFRGVARGHLFPLALAQRLAFLDGLAPSPQIERRRNHPSRPASAPPRRPLGPCRDFLPLVVSARGRTRRKLRRPPPPPAHSPQPAPPSPSLYRRAAGPDGSSGAPAVPVPTIPAGTSNSRRA